MPGRMPQLEQDCIKVLLEALKRGLADMSDTQATSESYTNDGIPTLTIYADGKPIIQIIVIATDLTPGESNPQKEQPCAT